MTPSTSINCFFDGEFKVPVESQIQRLYDAGFRVLDMNFWDWCHHPKSPFVGEDWRDWVAGIAEVAQRLNIRFTQAHAHVYNFYQEPDAPAKDELYRRSLLGAQMLGIQWVVFHPSAHPDGDEEQMIEDNVRFFAPFVELAERAGVGIALENMSRPQAGMTTAEGLAALIDRFGSARVGACWDTGHAHIAGVDQAASIRTLGPRLQALHVQDNDGVSDQHMAPHFGTIDWPLLMRALREIGFPNAFTFEAHVLVRRVPEGAKAAAARLLYQIGAELCAL